MSIALEKFFATIFPATLEPKKLPLPPLGREGEPRQWGGGTGANVELHAAAYSPPDQRQGRRDGRDTSHHLTGDADRVTVDAGRAYEGHIDCDDQPQEGGDYWASEFSD